MSRCVEDLRFRGLIHQASDDALFGRLDDGRICAYVGFDPTADSLHLGNLLQLCNLRRLQLAGHRPIALAGGATGMIGDPGGKDEERSLLDDETLAANLAGISPQLERFLDFGEGAGDARALLANNADWLATMPLVSFLRDVGKHFTVGQMVAKESVRSRIERPEQGISYTEFSYMLLQAYDFLELHDRYGCELQMGGSDQWGNITMGIDLIRRRRSATAFALTSPLVTKADGTKFGKSESGALFLNSARTSPYALYQYLFRSEDAVVGAYLRYFTFFDHDAILDLDEKTASRPQDRAAQRALARSVCSLVHGESETARVERAIEALYSEDIAGLDEATLLMALSEAPSTTLHPSSLDGRGLDLAEVLATSGLCPSRSAARVAIAQGGAYVNNRRVATEGGALTAADLVAGRYILLRRGKRDLHLLRFA